MGILDHLTEKPWLTSQARAEALHAEVTSYLPAANLGLRVLLAVIAILFSIMVVVYTDRMTFADWRPLPEPWLLWLNTAMLIASSVGLQRAWNSARQGRIDGVRVGLLFGGVLTIAFLVGQLVVWRQLIDLGYFAAANPANAFFYMLTTVHGLHLLGGLVAWGRTIARVRRGDVAERISSSVGLCAVYWHFLLVVWLILFGLLLFT